MSTVKNKGLGRGLNAIFDVEIKNKQAAAKISDSISEIDLDLVTPNPSQPRTTFDQQALEELSVSIKSLGLVQPITVNSNPDGSYTIISGERRYRAAKMAGIKSLPAYVRTENDAMVQQMALVENIQRQDLNPLEIAISLERLLEEFEITQEELATKVGKKRSTVTNYIRLLRLPAEVQLALSTDIISMGHAKALVNVDSQLKQLSLLKRIVAKSLSVRQTEELVKSLSEVKEKPQPAKDEEYPEIYVRLVDQLERYLTQDISIKRSKNGDGKIVIGFKSDEDINNIISRFEQFEK